MEPLPTQTADYWARPEQIVPVDTSGGLVTVYLPPADRTNAGRMVTVTRVAGAASFSTRAVSGTVGRAGVHTATSGSRLFVSDGNGDWMVFA